MEYHARLHICGITSARSRLCPQLEPHCITHAGSGDAFAFSSFVTRSMTICTMHQSPHNLSQTRSEWMEEVRTGTITPPGSFVPVSSNQPQHQLIVVMSCLVLRETILNLGGSSTYLPVGPSGNQLRLTSAGRRLRGDLSLKVDCVTRHQSN